MGKYGNIKFAALFILGILLVGCSNPLDQKNRALTSDNVKKNSDTNRNVNSDLKNNPTKDTDQQKTNQNIDQTNEQNNVSNQDNSQGDNTDNMDPSAIKKVSDPLNIDVVVNKFNVLPANYQPPDLVTPNIPFLYQDPQIHLMRKVAVNPLEQLVAGAKKDGIYIDGVSAYRSYALQKTIYDQNVATEGAKLANMYSAKPGTSDHQTGLAIDVSDNTGKYAIEDGFANTAAAKWLAQHAFEYGFIIRYPKGKESITGYSYEPWHIRYVGKSVAMVIYKNGWALEEYVKNMGNTNQDPAQVK